MRMRWSSDFVIFRPDRGWFRPTPNARAVSSVSDTSPVAYHSKIIRPKPTLPVCLAVSRSTNSSRRVAGDGEARVCARASQDEPQIRFPRASRARRSLRLRGWLSPCRPAWRTSPRHARTYSYLKRLHGWQLLDRARDGLGLLLYRQNARAVSVSRGCGSVRTRTREARVGHPARQLSVYQDCAYLGWGRVRPAVAEVPTIFPRQYRLSSHVQ